MHKPIAIFILSSVSFSHSALAQGEANKLLEIHPPAEILLYSDFNHYKSDDLSSNEIGAVVKKGNMYFWGWSERDLHDYSTLENAMGFGYKFELNNGFSILPSFESIFAGDNNRTRAAISFNYQDNDWFANYRVRRETAQDIDEKGTRHDFTFGYHINQYTISYTRVITDVWLDTGNQDEFKLSYSGKNGVSPYVKYINNDAYGDMLYQVGIQFTF